MYCRGSHSTHACMHTRTQRSTCTIPAFMQTQWFSSRTQTVASLHCSPASLLLLLLFTKQHRTLLSPEEKEQNLQEGHRGSVVLLYTGEQHPFDWEPEVRAWLPKPAGFFGDCVCGCVGVCAQVFVHACVCVPSMCVLAFQCVLASGCMKPHLLMLRESHKLFLWQTEGTWQHSLCVIFFIHTVNYSIWLALACGERSHGMRRNSLLMLWWVTLRDTLWAQFHSIPHYSLSSLSPLKPVNRSNTWSLIRLDH